MKRVSGLDDVLHFVLFKFLSACIDARFNKLHLCLRLCVSRFKNFAQFQLLLI